MGKKRQFENDVKCNFVNSLGFTAFSGTPKCAQEKESSESRNKVGKRRLTFYSLILYSFGTPALFNFSYTNEVMAHL
jgi:hypothetical protein